MTVTVTWAGIRGCIAPNTNQFIVTRESGIISNLANRRICVCWITNANVVASTKGVGVVIAITTCGSKGGIPGVNTGIDNADNNTFTQSTNVTSGRTIPNCRSTYPGGTGIRLQFKDFFAFDTNNTGEFGNGVGFGGGHFGGKTVEGCFVFKGDG